jgi:predicted ester cyclase
MSIEANRAVATWLMRDVWSRGDLSAVEQNVAPEFTGHFRNLAQRQNPDALRAMVSNWRSAFPDLVHEITASIAEGDLVALRIPFSGTHTGVFRFGSLTVQPTGRRVNVSEMLWLRFEAGKIVEVWSEFDLLGLLEQLGVTGNRAQPPAATTASG